MSNVKNIVSLLGAAISTDITQITVPGTKSKMDFAPMTASHQKRLTKACFNHKELKTTVYEILKELNPGVANLTPIDLGHVLIALRARYIGETFVEKGTKREVLLSKVIDRNDSIDISTSIADKTVEYSPVAGGAIFKFVIGLPTLKKEYDSDIYFKNTVLTQKGEVEETSSNALSSIIQIQVANYIKRIEVAAQDKTTVIDFADFPFVTLRIEILESLPSAALSIIYEAIRHYINIADSLVTYEGTKITPDENFFIITPKN